MDASEEPAGLPGLTAFTAATGFAGVVCIPVGPQLRSVITKQSHVLGTMLLMLRETSVMMTDVKIIWGAEGNQAQLSYRMSLC